MENEKQKSMKVKILSLVASLVLCFLLIGVSVYAALTQTLTIDNTITITTSGQTKVAVKVSEYLNEGVTAVSKSPETISDWTVVLDKSENTDEATINTSDEVSGEVKSKLSPIDFNHTTGVNYYAYKFEFTNKSTAVDGKVTKAHISTSAVDNTELTIYYGDTLSASMTSLTNNDALDTTITLPEKDGGAKEFYIIVASNVALEALTEKAGTPFNISITLDQQSA